jgi:maltose O-acetyltransferase
VQYLPSNYTPFIGKLFKRIRYINVRRIFKYCGKNVNVNRRAFFGTGFNITIGDNSGLGANCHVPDNIQIGKNVMMAENCCILARNHKYDRLDIPMIQQGVTEKKPVVIGDDVWIGRDVIFTPGRIVKTGSIIAAGCVLCRDFSEYSVIGGNPSKLIKQRKQGDL